MAPEIVVALIGGGAGLISGALGSLFAPWTQWGVEKRRLRRARRVELVQEWRAGVAELRELETMTAPMLPVPGPPGHPGGFAVVVRNQPDPIHTDVSGMKWYVTMRPHLSPQTRADVDALRQQRIHERWHKLPDLLGDQIARLERKWGLL